MLIKDLLGGNFWVLYNDVRQCFIEEHYGLLARR